MNTKLKLGATIWALGFLGVLTMLTINFPMESLPKEVVEQFSPSMLKVILLINPMILLLVAVLIGTFLYEKVALYAPTISSALGIETPSISFLDQLKNGVIYGLLAGVLTIGVGVMFHSSLPQEFLDLGEKMKINVLARFGYGGITEEILMRYGFMTLVVWGVSKLSQQLNNTTYWIGIILASLLFAAGHLPVAFSAVKEPNAALIAYIMLGNSIAGMFLGWLYWKKGLEAAMIAHIFAHVAMLLGEEVFHLT